MSKLSLTPVNVQFLATAPTLPTLRAGDMYFDTVGACLMTYDGTKWSRSDSTGSYQTIPTAGATTTFTLNSPYTTFFTGGLTQTVLLPVVTTLTLGVTYTIANQSSGVVTVQSSAGSTILAITPEASAIFTCILVTGTTAASWDAEYTAFATVTGTGANVLGTLPTISLPAIDNPKFGYTTTASSVTAIVLTVASNNQQYITGTVAQTVTLPVASTMTLGMRYRIVNNSTAITTINSSGGNLVASTAAGAATTVTCILTSGTAAASWDVDATFVAVGNITGLGTGVSTLLAAVPSGTTALVGTGSPTITTPTIATVNGGGATATPSLYPDVTTGTIAIGAGLTTGTLNIDAVGTGAHTTNLATGVTVTGVTKAVNVGTAGASGSTTNVTIGSATAGALGTTAINGTTAATTVNIGVGATLNAVTKAVNIGTNGVSGSTTNIAIGSGTVGALGTTTLNGQVSLSVAGDVGNLKDFHTLQLMSCL